MSSPKLETSTIPPKFTSTRPKNSNNEAGTSTSKADHSSTENDGISKRNNSNSTSISQSLIVKGSKSPEKCPICLVVPDDRSYTDSCYHEFCFVCLVEWSKIKAECPLCKQKFKNIIHNIRSADDYDKYVIPEETESFGIDDAGRRFRFPTTMTVERVELLRLIRQLHLQMEEMQRNNQIIQRDRQMYVKQLARIRRLRHLFERSVDRRERLTATSDFRRVVYERRLRSIPTPEERTRRSSPLFYSQNPASMHRLMPWLDRELNVLMSGRSDRKNFLSDLIRQMLVRWPINSPESRRFLSNYLGQYTDAFLHEFDNFARSPYDMEEYDRNIQYESWRDVRARLRGPNEAPPEIVIGSSPSPDRNNQDDDDEIDWLDSSDNPIPFRNPSPPLLNRWSPAAAANQNDRAQAAMLNRFQQMMETNLMQLDARRNTATTSSLRPNPILTRGRPYNGLVELLSSSSEDDDSPRLDANARTPPYLLPSRKRNIIGSSTLNGIKKQRLLAPIAASSTSHASAGTRNGGNFNPIILEDDDDEDIDVVGGRRRGRNDETVEIFSPDRSRSTGSKRSNIETDVDGNVELSDTSFSNGGIYSPVDSNLDVEVTSPTYSTPAETTPTLASPSPLNSWVFPHSSGSDRDFSPIVNLSMSPRSETTNSTIGNESPGPSISYMRLGRTNPYSAGAANWYDSGSSTSTITNRYDRRFPSQSPSPINRRRRYSSTESTRSPSPINPDDIQIVAELKPKYLRTPELVTLPDDGEEGEIEIEEKPMVVKVEDLLDDGPSTSGVSTKKRDRSSSRERKRHKKSHKKHRHHHRDRDRDRDHDREHKKKKKNKKEKKEKKSKRRHRDKDSDRDRDEYPKRVEDLDHGRSRSV